MLVCPGKWESDTDMKATCKKDKVEILEYCKKVYPERDITNIVESSHYVKINNWCKLGQKKCRTGAQQWVKPYRCLGESLVVVGAVSITVSAVQGYYSSFRKLLHVCQM